MLAHNEIKNEKSNEKSTIQQDIVRNKYTQLTRVEWNAKNVSIGYISKIKNEKFVRSVFFSARVIVPQHCLASCCDSLSHPQFVYNQNVSECVIIVIHFPFE